MPFHSLNHIAILGLLVTITHTNKNGLGASGRGPETPSATCGLICAFYAMAEYRAVALGFLAALRDGLGLGLVLVDCASLFDWRQRWALSS